MDECLEFGFDEADRLNFYRESYFARSIFASTAVERYVLGSSSLALASRILFEVNLRHPLRPELSCCSLAAPIDEIILTDKLFRALMIVHLTMSPPQRIVCRFWINVADLTR